MKDQTQSRGRRWRRVILIVLTAVLSLCVVGAGAIYLQNRNRPTASVAPERLNDRDAALAAEFFRLRAAVGEEVWPGWGTADIPLALYNEAYIFLIGYEAPPAGWARPPGLRPQGGPWTARPALAPGLPLYRQPLAADTSPGAFTIKVGERWVASMTTREWMSIAFADQFEAMVPDVLDPIFPYVPVTTLFVNSSDFYVAALAHESFHAYVGMLAPGRLLTAEASLAAEAGYPWDHPAGEAAWAREMELLMAGAKAEDEAAAAVIARDFLAQRATRRDEMGLNAAQIQLEQEREWSEGLAKYVELSIWGAAAEAEDYRPVAGLTDDPDFDGYDAFAQRWSQEVAQIGRSQSQAGEGRFYYSGMAQAFLLDQLRPGWQHEALAPGVYLENLLAQAVADLE